MIKGFEDAFTDLQSEFVSLCMEYTNESVDKIYIYIYQDTSERELYLLGILPMMRPLTSFYRSE